MDQQIETETPSEAIELVEATTKLESFFHQLSFLLLRFLNQLKKTGRSANTIASYKRDLVLFCEFLVEKQIHPETYSFPLNDHWVHFLKENGRASAASQRRAQMSVRTFLHFLVRDKIISGSSLLEVKSPKQPTHGLLIISHHKFKHLCKTLKEEAL
ncbi:MAG: site-specific integrase, partial [Silvanigrellaceae bacterium]|nr:site-specific integrase [Silvanigrellaceae bacterium]